jgi:ferritin-like metal-binding protein YciE
MDDKSRQTVTKYLGDMKAVVGHTKSAMSRQRDGYKDHPAVVSRIADIESELDEQIARIEERLEQLGGSPTAPLKDVAASVAGGVAGLYDMARTEGVAKALRDDFVAMSLCYVSWSMLHTTAGAFGDLDTSRIAEQGVHECARAVLTLDGMIPSEVERELQDSGSPLEQGASGRTERMSGEAWSSERVRASADRPAAAR